MAAIIPPYSHPKPFSEDSNAPGWLALLDLEEEQRTVADSEQPA
jgi:hypothetical protein